MPCCNIGKLESFYENKTFDLKLKKTLFSLSPTSGAELRLSFRISIFFRVVPGFHYSHVIKVLYVKSCFPLLHAVPLCNHPYFFYCIYI
jgi:hypothetical protein